MHKFIRIFSIMLFVSVMLGQIVHAQKEVKLEFIKHNVEVFPGEVFHNVLIVENQKKETQEFVIFINSPNHWKVIGETTHRYRLLPDERIYLPIQVASSGESKGGIGYAVTAVMNDISGNMIKAESCILNIPRDSKLEVRLLNNYRYFDLQTNEADFQLKLNNIGNTDQQINIRVEPGKSLLIPGNETNFSQINFMLEPKKDSTLNFTIKLKETTKKELFTNHRAEIQILGSDTIIKQTAWFNYLDWKYANTISDTERPLIFEVIGNDISGDSESNWQFKAHGNIQFKNHRKIRYSIQNLTRSNVENTNFWYNSRMYAEYSQKNDHIYGIGDYRGSFQQSLYGRGAWTEHRIKKKHSFRIAVTDKIEYDAIGIGGSYNYKLKAPVMLTIGGAYTDNRYGYINSLSGFAQASSSNKKFGKIDLLYGHSLSEYYNPGYTLQQYQGHAIFGSYSNTIKNNNINAAIDYGSPLYSGISKGRLNGYVNVISPLSDKLSMASNYTRQDYHPVVIRNNDITKSTFSYYNFANSSLRYTAIKNIQLFAGPYFENKSTNTYSDPLDITPFSSQKIGGEAGLRMIESYTTNSFSFAAQYGYTFVTQIPESISETYNLTQRFPSLQLRSNIRRNNWSIYAIYQQGPKSIAEEFAYTLSPLTIRSIMVMPSYEKWLYKQDIKFTLRGNYINNLTAKSSRLNLTNRLDWFMPKGWSAFIDNMFSVNYQSPYLEASTMATGSQTSSYFRIGIKKIFGFNQPRVKYIDLDAVFYRDNNGDGLRTADEPGVPNVLAGFKRIPQEGEDPGLKSEFNGVELLSEFEGKTALRDIPAGTYEVSYIPTNGREGNFITDRATKIVKIDNDSTLHIPFTDKNKVYGYVVVKEAEHSIMEDPPLDNIKIVAKGVGKSQSTLTDKNGYFEMYIPVADYYRIETSNIDPEHYTLQQPFYIVKFNGYKEFELNFVFEEKERTIQFDEDLSFLDTDEYTDTDTNTDTDETDETETDTEGEDIDINVQPLRQINVKGEIRDENTMNPVHARISIVNRTNDVPITETVSSQRTGIYAASLISSDPLYIKVKAKGYWTHKENLRTGIITTFDNINKDVRLSPIVIGQKIDTPELTFGENQSTLTPRAQVELENLLGILHENSHVTINIEGHSDSMEALDEESSNISLKRAQAAAEYLKRGGIRPERITNVEGKSDKSPAITEVDSQSRAENRRVEIIVSGF